MANILDLPSELLLRIAALLRERHPYKNKTLLSLSLASKRFADVVREELLGSPAFHFWKVGHVVKMYYKYPFLINKVRTIEIHSFGVDEGISKMEGYRSTLNGIPLNYMSHRSPATPPELDVDFHSYCWTKILSFHNMPKQSKDTWLRALSDNYHYRNAFFALLLVTLPYVEEILLGPTVLYYFPMFESILQPYSLAMRDETPVPAGWNQPYLVDVFDKIIPRLQSLELPNVWSLGKEKGWYQQELITYGPDPEYELFGLRSMHRFSSLRRLVVPHDALMGIMFETRSNRKPMLSMEQVSKSLPPRLEHLIITGMDNWTVRYIVKIVENKIQHFPALQRITAYFPEPFAKDHDTAALQKSTADITSLGLTVGLNVEFWYSKVKFPRHERDGYHTYFEDGVKHIQPWRYTFDELDHMEAELIEKWSWLTPDVAELYEEEFDARFPPPQS